MLCGLTEDGDPAVSHVFPPYELAPHRALDALDLVVSVGVRLLASRPFLDWLCLDHLGQLTLNHAIVTCCGFLRRSLYVVALLARSGVPVFGRLQLEEVRRHVLPEELFFTLAAHLGVGSWVIQWHLRPPQTSNGSSAHSPCRWSGSPCPRPDQAARC